MDTSKLTKECRHWVYVRVRVMDHRVDASDNTG